jgi:hypothetical protein
VESAVFAHPSHGSNNNYYFNFYYFYYYNNNNNNHFPGPTHTQLPLGSFFVKLME